MSMNRIAAFEAGMPTAGGSVRKNRDVLRIPAVGLGLLMLLLIRDGSRIQSSYAHTNQGPGVIWHDPGAVELLDFACGPGGDENRPRSPFVFLKPLTTGRTPKIKVRDARGREWVVKWGTEMKAETFATRVVWASGYFVDYTYFVKTGRIEGIKNLGPASEFIAPDGSFKEARFELWNEGYLQGKNWSWIKNPFVGSQELNGLKIVIMLTSNWDNKDSRDTRPNTAIVEHVENGRREFHYVVDDWGSTLGKWGWRFFSRDTWDCKAFSEQTAQFITGVKDGVIAWGFAGSRDMSEGIRVEDVQWVLSFIGRITDSQIKAGLEASGATPEENECFGAAIRRRINQMKEVVRVAASNRKI